MASPESVGGTPEKGVVLVLPNNPQLRARLEAKLQEYRQRLIAEEKAMGDIGVAPYRSPERLGSVVYYDSYYKIAVLERLLNDGRVAAEPLSLELLQMQGDGFDSQMYVNAFQVIEVYVKGTGGTLIGGTGLPDSQE